MSPLRIAIVAGEASGDNLAAGLITQLKTRYRAIEFEGIAGPKMINAGCHAIANMDRLAVMGLWDVLQRLPELLRLRATLKHRWQAHPPDLFIGIDAPDFNIKLAAGLKQQGIKTVQYVSPTVWAWRPKRIHKIAQSIDLMLVLFPFEQAIYTEHNIPVKYVGHPLADAVPLQAKFPKDARSSLGLPPSATVIGLLPGSRSSELKYLGPLFLKTAACLAAGQACVFITPCVDDPALLQMQQIHHTFCQKHGKLDLKLIEGNAHLVMQSADALLVASGTATLEALLHKRPMVMAYRLGKLQYMIYKHMIKIHHFALPNLLAGFDLIPEFMQDDAQAQTLATALKKALEAGSRQEKLLEHYHEIHQKLRCNANHRAADAVQALLGGPH